MREGVEQQESFIDRVHAMGYNIHNYPEGSRIEKFQSREAILQKSSFQYRRKLSIENGFFIPGPSLAAEKQGPEIEIFKRE